jgi:two-component system KDP operon response regulator KdpE
VEDSDTICGTQSEQRLNPLSPSNHSHEGTTHSPNILIIDDEARIRRLLRMILETNGYKVFEAAVGNDGLTMAKKRRPDAVILDLGLPDIDGLVVLKRLREWTQVPVIVLSVRESPEDKVAALDIGADDFVTKPFNTEELLARLRVAERHAKPAQEENLVFVSGPLQVDLKTRKVTLRGQDVNLTSVEYSLLATLVRNAGKVATHRQILKEVWGATHEGQTHYVRVYMAHLRDKLESDPRHPEFLLTESGVGYRLAILR